MTRAVHFSYIHVLFQTLEWLYNRTNAINHEKYVSITPAQPQPSQSTRPD